MRIDQNPVYTHTVPDGWGGEDELDVLALKISRTEGNAF